MLHALLENEAIVFFILLIENFSRVSDQDVDFLNKTSRNRNALSQSEKIKNRKSKTKFKIITIILLLTLRRVNDTFINIILYL